RIWPSIVIIIFHLITYETADLQAGLGAGDVEIARAVDVADAHIFHRLRFRDDNRVGGLRARNCSQRRRRTDEKPLDAHMCLPHCQIACDRICSALSIERSATLKASSPLGYKCP